MSRTFSATTVFDDSGLDIALAPGLGVEGVEVSPSFFHGFATHPQVLARGLVTLADITATRYFNYVPTNERDPILSAHGDRLRAECFSACNGVYACLEIHERGLDGGEIGRGTTNVDLSPASRAVLSAIPARSLLHVDVGAEGLTASTLEESLTERPVEMPERWVRALGNASSMHREFHEVFSVPQSGARAFLASLPSATGTGKAGWLTNQRGMVKVSARKTPSAVYVKGLHRLSAMKRLLTHVQSMSFHAPVESNSTAGAMVSLELPGARLTLGLTDEEWRGHSGEGSLLVDLAKPQVKEDAALLSALLSFEPIIDVDRLAREAALSPKRVEAALAVLAASGRVGWDIHDHAYFHRELPDNPDAIEKANPRLVSARKLVADNALRPLEGSPRTWIVRSGDAEYQTTLGENPEVPEDGARCTCSWYLAHAGNRGPCKHVLAASMIFSGTDIQPEKHSLTLTGKEAAKA
ncbi:MAG: SWIM zinc finger family protein [Corynebacterium sp.]|uniref:SWIM zinc finger family protein n=1 Tax=Corynebacterium sp. TaxID=1720 RepID=UPI0026DD5B88|nr:SWIM zinc finger family protein [Corynebacterium sp.]MDO4760918.1 SWIM zinc finger family protein [Corynebacterium sp.]